MSGDSGQTEAREESVLDKRRWFVPPLGWPMHWRAVTISPSKRHPLLVLNRYPGQVIGFAVRLPDADSGAARHRALSVMWAKPARWWPKRWWLS